MNIKTIFSFLFTLIFVLAVSACGAQATTQAPENSKESQTPEELQQMIFELHEKENAILQNHEELWKTFYASANENSTTYELKENFNYGEYLSEALEKLKDHFSDEDYQKLLEDAKQITQIEKKLQPLYAKHEELSASNNNDGSETSICKFPSFQGKDFEGNAVDNQLFSEHSVTVMNFWYPTCKACVEEFEALEDLSKKLTETNGILIGVNAFTQSGDSEAIADAKEVLAKKGVTYPNICFDSESEAGKFTEQMSVFPSTYVIDKNGNVVGEPVIGSVNTPEQMEKLQKLIDTALEK